VAVELSRLEDQQFPLASAQVRSPPMGWIDSLDVQNVATEQGGYPAVRMSATRRLVTDQVRAGASRRRCVAAGLPSTTQTAAD
jgi:hypothetical protein